MRLVDRTSVEKPAFFSSPEVHRAEARISAILALAEGRRDERRPPIDRKLVLRPPIARALFELFEEQCAFCGTCLAASKLHIHHFRPPLSAEAMNGRASPHHYAWLAYKWENLYLACAACIQAKAGRFPVRGERGALNADLKTLAETEQGTIIDPCHHDPTEHLSYDWSGVCHALTERGRITIQVFDLNRSTLIASRYEVARQLVNVARRFPTRVASLLRALDGRYSAHTGVAANLLRQKVSWPDSIRPASDSGVGQALKSLLPADRKGALESLVERRKTKRQVSKKPIAGTRLSSKRRSFPASKRSNAQARLARIDIQNFKAIEHLTIALDDRSSETGQASCLALLGENSTGKTSILEAIALALLGTEAIQNLPVRASDFARRANIKQWNRRPNLPLEVTLHFHGAPPVALRWSALSRGFKGTKQTSAIVLAYGPRRYFSKVRKRHFATPWRQVLTLFDPLATIPHPELWLQRVDTHTFSAAVRALREILLLNSEDDIVRAKDKTIYVKAKGVLTPLDRLSEGYRSTVALAVDIMRELLSHWDALEHATGIVLIDEVETHLHPRWKLRIMAALRRALPGVQFIVTTHDPLCLRGMSNGEVQVLNNTPDDGVELLKDLPNIHGLRADQLLTSDYFGLASTVDPAVEMELAEYSTLVAKKHRAADEQDRLVELAGRLQKTIVLGDTARDQVVYEGLEGYLTEKEPKTLASIDAYVTSRKTANADDRSASRDRAVASVIAALRGGRTT